MKTCTKCGNDFPNNQRYFHRCGKGKLRPDCKKCHKRDWKAKSAKRRGLKFIQIINNPFPRDISIQWHHIHDWFVIPIPRKLHASCASIDSNIHRQKVLKVINNIFLLNVEVFLYG